MIEPGDLLTLRAGWAPMYVLESRVSCDGTGGDGAGLRCLWLDGGPKIGWVSESSVRPVMDDELGHEDHRKVSIYNYGRMVDLLPKKEAA